MSEHRKDNHYRHVCRWAEFRLVTGILQPNILSDLPNLAPVVRQGSLGLERSAHNHGAPARQMRRLNRESI
jgi:hypothetical protein